ncbi:hypothetical protein [Thermithiobacillus plumbiphilus]|uniref:Aminoglycoside phosphotransferase domain-containing protein n=1 Tax=Thermithiobacillus plumbiphilus TaxID=1729899 RepID=A0ABU9D794_9PROT
MLIYRESSRQIDPAAKLAGLREDLMQTGHPSPEQATRWLIDFGMLEAAVVDARCPERDANSHWLQAWRDAALALGRLFAAGTDPLLGEQVPAALAACRQSLVVLAEQELPAVVQVREPEGYAYYALYPQSYLLAAQRFLTEQRPRSVICIGIRSIGTSLSAVVGGALQAAGVPVELFSVRPRGHPFSRELLLDADLADHWRAARDRHFLLVDEGPGLSGSSFAGSTEALSRLGIPDDRIVLFPSWLPDGGQFCSDLARARWPRHAKYCVSFEEADLARQLLGDNLRDLSGGGWRKLVYGDAVDWPVVQPQHERRKYLDADGRLWKFAGLGEPGERALARGQVLSEAGLIPPVLELRQGFLASKWLAGRPLRAVDYDRQFATCVAEYLAFRRQALPLAGGADFEELLTLIRVNVAEAFGESGAERCESLRGFESLVKDAPTVAIDGRMMPHEWLRTSSGFLKTDALDHTEDHFYPGPLDIAWDLAGCALEFGLDAPALASLARDYARRADDPDILRRLPFYQLAYAAFRLGYATLATQALQGDPEGLRWSDEVLRYGKAVQNALALCA